MQKINFENKPSTNSPINADNLNLLQDNVEDAIDEITISDIYSTSEIKTNKIWINSKAIYRKVVDIGSLPNDSYKSVDHNIENIDELVNVRAIAVTSGGYYFNIPFVGTPTIFSNTQIALRANTTHIQISSTTDTSNYTGYAILEYTKTTD